MNKNIIFVISLCLFSLISFTSCDRYPISALVGEHPKVNSWPNPWYIYDDELNTKGSMEPFKWDDSDLWESGKLNFSFTGNPQSGRKCISFTWVGNDKKITSYAGFGLMSTEQVGGWKDMSTSGYTNLRFSVRGHMYQNCVLKIEIPKKTAPLNPWVSVTITDLDIRQDVWREFVIPIPNVSLMTEIEYYLAMSLSANGGVSAGGTVYIDNIRFTKD